LVVLSLVFAPTRGRKTKRLRSDLSEIESPRIMEKAARYMNEQRNGHRFNIDDRSAGGEENTISIPKVDYWWPDSKNPDGPYIQREGMSNRTMSWNIGMRWFGLSEIWQTSGPPTILPEGGERQICPGRRLLSI